MDFIVIILAAAGTFGVCWLVDKGFTKIFRGKAQHASGLSVRLNKKYGAAGLILAVIGMAAVFAGLSDTWLLWAGGALLIAVGIALVVYYMTFGIFYDGDSFVYTTFGKRSVTYRYNQIRGQQLYVVQGRNIIVELHMTDGTTVQIQLQMEGAEKFMNTAFLGWARQKGLDPDSCAFHDPQNSCWFPGLEEV